MCRGHWLDPARYNCFGCNIYESVVFVKVIKVSELGRPFTTIVRLAPLNHCYMGSADSLEIGVNPTIECLRAAFNRKLCAGWLASGVKNCKSVDEIIKGTAEIIANLANENCDVAGNGDFGMSSYPGSNDEISGLRVEIRDESILIGPFDERESVPQITKVFFCPLYTQQSAIKAVTGCDSLHA
jgi:hypothetical protein